MNKRSDGFHNLETIFYPLPVYDVLELVDSVETTITTHGFLIPGNAENNIVLKAYNVLKKDFAELPPVHFHLLKNIPAGAGLGAGSANGAFALMALNKKFQLNLSNDQLADYALQLGSDCPFFIYNRSCFAKDRGEYFIPTPVDLYEYQMIIVNPGIHISTPWAFSQIQPKQPKQSLQHLIAQPIEEWKDTITNDFETPVFNAHPEIAGIKFELYKAGAVFALMSGSGSTVYGLFKNDASALLHFPENYFVKIIQPGQ